MHVHFVISWMYVKEVKRMGEIPVKLEVVEVRVRKIVMDVKLKLGNSTLWIENVEVTNDEV